MKILKKWKATLKQSCLKRKKSRNLTKKSEERLQTNARYCAQERPCSRAKLIRIDIFPVTGYGIVIIAPFSTMACTKYWLAGHLGHLKEGGALAT